MVLGLAGLGQAWRLAADLWHVPPSIGEGFLGVAALVWVTLMIWYGIHAVTDFSAIRDEFRHPVHGASPALLGIATLLMVPAVLPYSQNSARILGILGIGWQLVFALWHTGAGWRRGRHAKDISPKIYLPTVAGNLTCAAALAVLGVPDYGWLFFGSATFSWLALEPLIIQRIWHPDGLPLEARAALGIQFAPPAVAGTSIMVLAPDCSPAVLLSLWGYALFQLLLGLRLQGWLREQPFAVSYWSYTFGLSSAAVMGLRLALRGNTAGGVLALPVLCGATLFVVGLLVRTVVHRV